MADLPEIAAAELARLRAEWAEFGLDASLGKLMERPVMPAICRALADKLSGPHEWRSFFFAVLESANFAHLYFSAIKPDRQAFAKHRDDAIRAARELAAALGWLVDSSHGHKAPGEVNFLWFLIHESARAKDYPDRVADSLSGGFQENADSRLAELSQGQPGASPIGLPDLLAHLASALEAWRPEADGQCQGTAPGMVFVRALDHALARHGLDTKALLTVPQTADLTLAAMGWSDAFNKAGNRFGPGHVREARKYALKPD